MNLSKKQKTLAVLAVFVVLAAIGAGAIYMILTRQQDAEESEASGNLRFESISVSSRESEAVKNNPLSLIVTYHNEEGWSEGDSVAMWIDDKNPSHEEIYDSMHGMLKKTTDGWEMYGLSCEDAPDPLLPMPQPLDVGDLEYDCDRADAYNWDIKSEDTVPSTDFSICSSFVDWTYSDGTEPTFCNYASTRWTISALSETDETLVVTWKVWFRRSIGLDLDVWGYISDDSRDEYVGWDDLADVDLSYFPIVAYSEIEGDEEWTIENIEVGEPVEIKVGYSEYSDDGETNLEEVGIWVLEENFYTDVNHALPYIPMPDNAEHSMHGLLKLNENGDWWTYGLSYDKNSNQECSYYGMDLSGTDCYKNYNWDVFGGEAPSDVYSLCIPGLYGGELSTGENYRDGSHDPDDPGACADPKVWWGVSEPVDTVYDEETNVLTTEVVWNIQFEEKLGDQLAVYGYVKDAEGNMDIWRSMGTWTFEVEDDGDTT